MPHTIIQFTDLHLFAEPSTLLKGISTSDCWRRVLDQVRRRHPHSDTWIFTGDLTHDELPATYAALGESLGTDLTRCWFLPGNHDRRDLLRAAFGARSGHRNDDLAWAWSSHDWQLVGLDSHQPGQLSGRLGSAQLEWLRAQLSSAQPGRTLLLLHHPPVLIGSPWLDRIALEDRDAFWEVVSSNSAVAAIFTGHVHQESRQTRDAIPIFTTPATAVQFMPGTATLECDSRPPGYRVIELTETNWRTWVERLETDPAGS